MRTPHDVSVHKMVEVARINGGFIDQTEFKTSATYTFDTLIISEEVIKVLDCYIFHVRPLLNPVCNYLLVSTVGKQYTSFTIAMTWLVKEAFGKYINPTRYRQIIETESSTRLTLTEQEIIPKDQKHSSDVAKRFYRNHLSRDIATQGKMCIEKWLEIVEHTRKSSFLICCPRSIAIICCLINW